MASVAFSPDEHTLAGASYDQRIILWDVTDLAHPHTVGSPLTGHTSTVFAVMFSPDGHALAVASDENTLRLWDLTNPAHPHALGSPLTGHVGGLAGELAVLASFVISVPP